MFSLSTLLVRSWLLKGNCNAPGKMISIPDRSSVFLLTTFAFFRYSVEPSDRINTVATCLPLHEYERTQWYICWKRRRVTNPIKNCPLSRRCQDTLPSSPAVGYVGTHLRGNFVMYAPEQFTQELCIRATYKYFKTCIHCLTWYFEEKKSSKVCFLPKLVLHKTMNRWWGKITWSQDTPLSFEVSYQVMLPPLLSTVSYVPLNEFLILHFSVFSFFMPSW